MAVGYNEHSDHTKVPAICPSCGKKFFSRKYFYTGKIPARVMCKICTARANRGNEIIYNKPNIGRGTRPE